MASALDEVNAGVTSYETTDFNQPVEGSEDDPMSSPYDSFVGQGPDSQEIGATAQSAYQNVADEAGQAQLNVEGYDPTKTRDLATGTTQIKEGETYIDRAKSTVAGQLDSLLSNESPYINQARQRADERSQSRGLLNSTMAAQAGEAAAIRSALPIAQQDAQTYARAAGAEQTAENQAAVAEREALLSTQVQEFNAQVQRANQNIDNQFQSLMKGADAETQTALADLQQKYKGDYAKLESQLRNLSMGAETDLNIKRMAHEQAAATLQNYQVTVENMMTNPNFLELGAEEIGNAVNQLQNLATNQVNFIGNAAGTDFTDLIDFYFEPIGIVTDNFDENTADPVEDTTDTTETTA